MMSHSQTPPTSTRSRSVLRFDLLVALFRLCLVSRKSSLVRSYKSQQVQRLPAILKQIHDGDPDKILMFATVQGSPAFHHHARAFALEQGYSFGANADGTPMTGGRLFGLAIHDEAHLQCGVQEKPSVQGLRFAIQLCERSLSLTATPMVWTVRQEASCANISDTDADAEDVEESELDDDQSESLREDEKDSDSLCESEYLNYGSESDAVPAPKRRRIDPHNEDMNDAGASRLLGVTNAQFARAVRTQEDAADRMEDAPSSQALEQAFPWDEQMDLLASADELATRLGVPKIAGLNDTMSPEELLHAIARATRRPAVLLVASHYGPNAAASAATAYPFQRGPECGNRSASYTWAWTGAACFPDGDSASPLERLDPALFQDRLLVLGRTDRGQWALFRHEGADGPPPRGIVVHDQSGVCARDGPSPRAWNGNGHGPVFEIGWNEAQTPQDRMLGEESFCSLLPRDLGPEHPLFVPWTLSRLASVVEPLTPEVDPKLPDCDDLLYLAYFVRRLLLRHRQPFDEKTFAATCWSQLPELRALLEPECPFDVLRERVEEAVAQATRGRCTVAWWACDERGQPRDRDRPSHAPPGGTKDLENVLSLGYTIFESDEPQSLDDLLFPSGPPQRRRPMVEMPELVLMTTPQIATDVLARFMAQNLFGLVVEGEAAQDGRTATAPPPVPEVFEAAARDLLEACRSVPAAVRGVEDAWVTTVLDGALRVAKARRPLHPDQGGSTEEFQLRYPEVERAIECLRKARRDPDRRSRLLRFLREGATLQGGARPAASASSMRTVAQPQQIPIEFSLGDEPRTVFRVSLHHLMTAQTIVTLLTAAEPFRRRKIVVFSRTNVEARLVQGVVRGLLAMGDEKSEEDVYDAHVFRSMSCEGKVLETLEDEECQLRLKRFKIAKRALLFNCDYLTEGFNCPAIDAVVIDYPSKSTTEILQMIGRCMRVDPENPDKVPMVVLPVHDPQATSEAEFRPLCEELERMGALAIAPSGGEAEVQLGFTPWQRGFDAAHKCVDCLQDRAIATIVRAFHLTAKRGAAATNGHGIRPATRDAPAEKLLQLLVQADGRGAEGFLPLHVSEEALGALLRGSSELRVVWNAGRGLEDYVPLTDALAKTHPGLKAAMDRQVSRKTPLSTRSIFMQYRWDPPLTGREYRLVLNGRESVAAQAKVHVLAEWTHSWPSANEAELKAPAVPNQLPVQQIETPDGRKYIIDVRAVGNRLFFCAQDLGQVIQRDVKTTVLNRSSSYERGQHFDVINVGGRKRLYLTTDGFHRIIYNLRRKRNQDNQDVHNLQEACKTFIAAAQARHHALTKPPPSDPDPVQALPQCELTLADHLSALHIAAPAKEAIGHLVFEQLLEGSFEPSAPFRQIRAMVVGALEHGQHISTVHKGILQMVIDRTSFPTDDSVAEQ